MKVIKYMFLAYAAWSFCLEYLNEGARHQFATTLICLAAFVALWFENKKKVISDFF